MGKWSKQARARQSARLSGYWKAKKENGSGLSFDKDKSETVGSSSSVPVLTLTNERTVIQDIEACINQLYALKTRLTALIGN